MPSTPSRPGAVEIALLLSLATLWSSSFAFIKVAVETIPPLSVAAGRLTLAAVLIVAAARLRGLRFPREQGLWPKFFAIGLFGNALPFTLISWGEVTIDSGLAAILMAVMPLATLVLAHLFTSDERPTRPIEGWDLQGSPIRKVSEYIARPEGLPHNVMIDGNRLVLSHYTDGVRLLDIRDPESPVEIGFYDTFEGAVEGFDGAWGAYIFPASNLILVSDISGGLFVVQYTGDSP